MTLDKKMIGLTWPVDLKYIVPLDIIRINI